MRIRNIFLGSLLCVLGSAQAHEPAPLPSELDPKDFYPRGLIVRNQMALVEMKFQPSIYVPTARFLNISVDNIALMAFGDTGPVDIDRDKEQFAESAVRLILNLRFKEPASSWETKRISILYLLTPCDQMKHAETADYILTICEEPWNPAAGYVSRSMPAESSFIIRLADDAINADGPEAVKDRERLRIVFAEAFLNGYIVRDISTPMSPNLSNRLSAKGWNSGAAYRQANPYSVAHIMREYGYTASEATGTWSYGFEAGRFIADNVQEPPPSRGGMSCWDLSFIFDIDDKVGIGRVLPMEQYSRGGTIRLHVKGYLSPRGSGGNLGDCARIFYATDVSAEGE